MKKESPKKPAARAKSAPKKSTEEQDPPLEFDRGWQELESQHDRIKVDFNSLAAQLGIGSKSKPQEI